MTRLLPALVILFASVPRALAAQSAGNPARESGNRQPPDAGATRYRPAKNYNPAFTGVYYPDAPEPAPAAAGNGAPANGPAPGDSVSGPAASGPSGSVPSLPASSPSAAASRRRAADTGVYYPESPSSGATDADASNKGAAAVGIYRPDPPPVPPPGARETRVAAPDSGAHVPRRGPVTAADSLVVSACGDAPPGSEAPGLLAVLFRARTTDEVRQASAKQVGGTIAGESEEGENYVRFPPDAGAPSAVADRLIRLGPVTRVSPVTCPGPTR